MDEAWRNVTDAVKALADEEDLVFRAVALRGRVIDERGNEDEIMLSAALSALLVREIPGLNVAAGTPGSVVARFVIPRHWDDPEKLDGVYAWLDAVADRVEDARTRP